MGMWGVCWPSIYCIRLKPLLPSETDWSLPQSTTGEPTRCRSTSPPSTSRPTLVTPSTVSSRHPLLLQLLTTTGKRGPKPEGATRFTQADVDTENCSLSEWTEWVNWLSEQNEWTEWTQPNMLMSCAFDGPQSCWRDSRMIENWEGSRWFINELNETMRNDRKLISIYS